MQEAQPVERIPRDSVMYLPLPMPLAMAAITGSREGLVTSADLPPQPDDLNNAEAYYTWVGEVERILRERGVLDAYQREVQEGLTVARCPGWCHGTHPVAEGPLMAVNHTLPIRVADGTEMVRIVAMQSEDGTVEKPGIEVDIDTDSQLLTSDQAQECADALLAAAAILRVMEPEPPPTPDQFTSAEAHAGRRGHPLPCLLGG